MRRIHCSKLEFQGGRNRFDIQMRLLIQRPRTTGLGNDDIVTLAIGRVLAGIKKFRDFRICTVLKWISKQVGCVVRRWVWLDLYVRGAS